jgi:predicted membrane metal-binding protein
MLTIGGICFAFGRRVAPTSVLALSFLATTLLMPRSVHSLSFQLSFLALTGILLLSGPISTALPRAIPRLVRRGLGAALGAQLATVPLVLSSFGVVYPVGLVAGLLLAPLATGFLWAGIAATASAGAGAAVLAGTGPDPASLVLVTGSYRALLGVAEISARAPALYSGLAAVGFYATVLALIAGLGVYRAREARRLALRLPRLGGGSHGCGCPGGASHGGAL